MIAWKRGSLPSDTKSSTEPRNIHFSENLQVRKIMSRLCGSLRSCWSFQTVTTSQSQHLSIPPFFLTEKTRATTTCFLPLQMPPMSACFGQWCTMLLRRSGSNDSNDADSTAARAAGWLPGRRLRWCSQGEPEALEALGLGDAWSYSDGPTNSYK